MRRPLAAGLLAAALLLPAAPSAAVEPTPPPRGLPETCGSDRPVPFGDVPEIYADAVGCLTFYGVTRGTTATTYSPAGVVSRAQMAVFVARALSWSQPQPGAGDVAFSDVDSPAEPSPTDGLTPEQRTSIELLAESGALSGHPDGSFRPFEPVTRAQMAGYLSGWARSTWDYSPDAPENGSSGLGPQLDCFVDVAPDGVHAAVIREACGGRVAVGDGAGSFRPGASVTRGQMALFLTRTMSVKLDDHQNLATPDL